MCHLMASGSARRNLDLNYSTVVALSIPNSTGVSGCCSGTHGGEADGGPGPK